MRRWKIHFPPFTLPSSSLKIIISISKACLQSDEEKRKEKFAKQQKEVNEEVENPAGNFQLFTIFRVHFTLLSERTKEFFSLFLINYGNYSGCLHYASGERRPSCYAPTYGMWLFIHNLVVKNVCSLKWALGFAVSMKSRFRDCINKFAKSAAACQRWVFELKNRFSQNLFISGAMSMLFQTFILCNQFFVTCLPVFWWRLNYLHPTNDEPKKSTT